MDDEVRQIREEIFSRIVLGLVVIGLVAGFVAVVADGFGSPWFIRAIILILTAVTAFIIRLFGRFVVASYVLIIPQVGLVAEMFLHPGAISGFAPYLLIPVVAIAGFLLSPLATLLVAISSIVLVLLVIALTGQLTAATFLMLVPAFILTLIAAFLTAESNRYFHKLGDLLADNRKLLKERTLEGMEAKKQVEALKRQITELEQQPTAPPAEASQHQLLTVKRDARLIELIEGTIQEVQASIIELEESIEQAGELMTVNGSTDVLKSVWRRLDYLRSLTVNLSELVPIEGGEVKLNYRPVDVGRLIREVASTAEGLARGKSLEVRSQAPEDLPTVQADPVRLRQVLLQLMQNAIKFTDQGIIEIQAEVNKTEMLIFVSDTGIGMHREEAELIFERFGRGSGTMAQQRQGTGLGLAISKRLVELHGGHMWVTSVLGIGSTFYLSLPIEQGSEQPVATADLSDSKLVAAVPAAANRTIVSSTSAPAAAVEQEEPTIALPASTVSIRSSDPEATILSRPEPRPVRHPAQPIHRYGPTYVRRFGLILLGLLLIVMAIVAILAILNPPNDTSTTDVATVGEADEPPTTVTPGPPSTPTSGEAVALPGTETPEAAVVTATQRPTSTLPVQATQTPTSLPVQPAATEISTPGISSTGSTLPTLAPVSPTSVPSTPTPSATNTPVPTNTTVPTNTPLPTATTAVTTVPAQDGSDDLPQLRFLGGDPGRMIVPGLDVGGGADGNSGLKVVDSSRLSWAPTGQVLFAGEQGGDRDIYVSDTDNGPAKLTSVAGDDLQPAWSPDGQRIAFSSGRTGNFNIYVMDPDGRNQTQLTDSRGFDEWPVWSPDGRQLAFVSDRSGNAEIYVMDADGSNQVRLTDNPADDWPAAWSPDGRWLAFASERDEDWNLFVIPAAGGSAVRLTNASGAERDPIWSPDGQTIAFAYNDSGNWDVYTLPVPTANFTVVPLSAWTQITDTSMDERYPVWSR